MSPSGARRKKQNCRGSQEETNEKPGYYETYNTETVGVPLTEENLHLTPFACNLVPWSEETMLSMEVGFLKEDAGTEGATVSLDLNINSQSNFAVCAVCGADAQHKCQNCLEVNYCSREHQKIHWKTHRPFCILFDVSWDSASESYYLIAKSNVKKGEAIFIEKPIVVSPYSGAESFHLLNFDPVSANGGDGDTSVGIGKYNVEEYEKHVRVLPVVCLGCCMFLIDTYVPCDGCGWPICSVNCHELEMHRNLECSYFKKHKLSYEEVRKKALLSPRIFGVIRCLLLRNIDSSSWKMIENEKIGKLWEGIGDPRINKEYILVVLKTIFGFEEVTYSDVNNILGLINLKGIYGCVHKHLDDGKHCRTVLALYRNASAIGHKCVGNVFTVQTNPISLHVIASRNIKKGEILYRNYDLQGDLNHVIQRQQFAVSITGNLCNCELCAGNEDNALSAIVCLKCKRRKIESHMLIEQPRNYDSLWKCFKCGATKSMAQVNQLLAHIVKDMNSYFYCEQPNACESLIQRTLMKYKAEVLHPFHSVILAFEYELINLMMEPTRFSTLNLTELELLTYLLKSRIQGLECYVPSMHSSLVSAKMRLVAAIYQQAYVTPLLQSAHIVKTIGDLETIYDDVASAFVEKSRKNVVQWYIMLCLRKIREIFGQVGELYNGQQRFLKGAMRLQSSTRMIENITENCIE